MTKKATEFKEIETPAPTQQKKLSRKEKDEAFRLMNENWAKGMDIYLAALENQKERDASR